MRRFAAIVVILAAVVAACSSNSDAEPPGPGRLVIIDDSGNVALVDRDGTDRTAVTDDAGATSVYFQPTWSPDATRLAFSRAGVSSSEVVIHETDTDARASVDTAFPAFYFSWAPTGDRVAFLGNGPSGGLQLSVVDTAGTELRVDVGQPYYFAWHEDGSMVVHVGTDELAVVDPDGAYVETGLGAPGVFRAPEWTDDGILYVERGTDVGRLVLTPEDGEARLLAEVPGGASFSTSPAGDRVAVQAVASDQIGDFAGAGRLAAAQEASRLPANRIVVLDLETLEWTRVGDDPVLAFWWSPDGERLLVLTVPDASPRELAWRVWFADAGLGETLDFVPGPELFRDVVPFFDQYARSLTLWSPDGSEFAFPGTIDGEAGIWVVAVGDDGAMAPTKIAEGTWVAWSPR
jgi:TolB protein